MNCFGGRLYSGYMRATDLRSLLALLIASLAGLHCGGESCEGGDCPPSACSGVCPDKELTCASGEWSFTPVEPYCYVDEDNRGPILSLGYTSGQRSAAVGTSVDMAFAAHFSTSYSAPAIWSLGVAGHEGRFPASGDYTNGRSYVGRDAISVVRGEDRILTVEPGVGRRDVTYPVEGDDRVLGVDILDEQEVLIRTRANLGVVAFYPLSDGEPAASPVLEIQMPSGGYIPDAWRGGEAIVIGFGQQHFWLIRDGAAGARASWRAPARHRRSARAGRRGAPLEAGWIAALRRRGNGGIGARPWPWGQMTSSPGATGARVPPPRGV